MGPLESAKGLQAHSPEPRKVSAPQYEIVLFSSSEGNAHIIICGRNKANAERIMATFPRTDRSRYEFVQCDVLLMKNVSTAAAEIRTKVGAINYVVLSQGVFSSKGFDPTSEGIDSKLSLNFYSRWKVGRLACTGFKTYAAQF